MKRIISTFLALIMLAGIVVSVSADGGDAETTAHPNYYDDHGFITYDIYRIYVDLVPGFCGVFDELDYGKLFDGAAFASISDSDAAWRESYPDDDVFPDGYDAATHVRRLTVELYEIGARLFIYASEENAAIIDRALKEFRAFSFGNAVSVVPSADFDPYGYAYRVDDAYITRIEEMNTKYGDYVEYCKDYLDKFDCDGNGVIQDTDVFLAENAKRAALEAGEEYTGPEPFVIINFIVTAPGIPYMVTKQEDERINTTQLRRIIRYIEICENYGAEYLGPTVEGFYVNASIPSPGVDGSHLVMGDVDGSDSVNARDIVLAMRGMVDPNITLNKQAADVNCDGKLNSRDIVVIMKIAMGASVRMQSRSTAYCRLYGHTLSASYATETVHRVHVASPHCEKRTYLVISCGHEGCDYIEKILTSTTHIASCHG